MFYKIGINLSNLQTLMLGGTANKFQGSIPTMISKLSAPVSDKSDKSDAT